MPSSPLPLAEIPSLTLLYKLRHLASPQDTPHFQPKALFNEIISLIQHDITALEVSAIVNAANKALRGGGGVDGAIHARAGPNLLRECRTLGGCETGSAKITDAYNLPCEKVIHAVGPIYSVQRLRAPDRPAELLRGCYRTALQLAAENGCKSIAFSCISTGVYGYPCRQAADVVLKFVREWLQEEQQNCFGGIEHIVFCCFNETDVSAYEQLVPLYFPPVEDARTAAKDEENAAALEEALPDPPSAEPVVPGEPVSKKQKMSDESDDWEEIEKPDDYVAEREENDHATREQATNSADSTVAKEKGDSVDRAHQNKDSIKANTLLKDW